MLKMQCAAPVSTLFDIGARAHAEMKLQKECRALIFLSLSTARLITF